MAKENQRKLWLKKKGVITPGGDPAWYCPVCKKGNHVYGIEHARNYMHKCPDCNANLKYPWEE